MSWICYPAATPHAITKETLCASTGPVTKPIPRAALVRRNSNAGSHRDDAVTEVDRAAHICMALTTIRVDLLLGR
jgi:hypothetical protein